MTKKAMKLALDALIVCRQSNYGRNWCWPDTAIKTALNNVFEAIEALEKALKQEQDKPVAWVDVKCTHQGPYEFYGKELLPVGKHNLYTTPQQRKPLTIEQIGDFWLDRFDKEGSPIENFARAIESAHGIKE